MCWPKIGWNNNFMNGSAQPEDRFPAGSTEDATEDTIAASDQSPAAGAVGDKSNGNRTLEETELDSALQLLVERAQYITGATGTALALPRVRRWFAAPALVL